MFSAPLLIIFTHCKVQKESGVNVCSVGVMFLNQIACSSLNEGLTSLAENPRHTQHFHSLLDYNLTLLSSVTEKDVASITECKVTLLVYCIPHKSGVNRERRGKQVKRLNWYLHSAFSSFLGWNQAFVLSGGTAVQGSLKAMMQPHPHSRQSPPLGKEEDYIQETPGGNLQSFDAAYYLLWHLIGESLGEWLFFFKLVTRHVGICQRRLISSNALLFVFP